MSDDVWVESVWARARNRVRPTDHRQIAVHTVPDDVVFTPGHTDSRISDADDAFAAFLGDVDPLRILSEWAGRCPYGTAESNRRLMGRVYAAQRLAARRAAGRPV